MDIFWCPFYPPSTKLEGDIGTVSVKGLPDHVLAQFHLGMAYAKAGQAKEARAILSRAIELGAGQDLPQLAEAKAALDALPAQE